MPYKPPMHGRDHAPLGQDPLGPIQWCRVSTNAVADITVLSGVNKTITTFNQTEMTDGAIFSPTSSSIQVRIGGLYLLKGQTEWSSYGVTIPTSIRETWIVLTRSGDSSSQATETEASPLSDFVMVSGWARLLADDILSLVAHQDSGSSETIYGGNDGGSENTTQTGNYLELAYTPYLVSGL